MLPDIRITCSSFTFRSASPRWLFSLEMSFVSNSRLSNYHPIIQSYVARITLARKFIYNGTLLFGRNAILLNGWKGLFSGKQYVDSQQRNNVKISNFSTINSTLSLQKFSSKTLRSHKINNEWLISVQCRVSL